MPSQPQPPLRVLSNGPFFAEGEYAFTWVTPTSYVVGRVAKVYDNGDVHLVGIGDDGSSWRTAADRCTRLHPPQAQDDIPSAID